MTIISQKYLKELLDYNPETGEFKWKISRKGIVRGAMPGTIGKDGYRIIMLDGVNYYAHRLAWLFVTGAWPKQDIDHRNLDRLDNKFLNLREATRTQNMQNGSLRSDNNTGYKGVIRHKGNRFRAYIKHNGKQIHLGLFATKEAAKKAREEAALKLFGEFANE